MTELRRSGRSSRRVLIIVQNLPVPLDRRVWLECQALTAAGYGVSVICPMGPGDAAFEDLDGVRIHRYPPPPQAEDASGYVREFAYCWFQTARLAFREYRQAGFGVIQACNPPDTYFALAALFRPLGVRFVFDHHDLCPEVYTARFGRAGGLLHRGLLLLERLTFRLADRVISTNDSYREVAIGRGRRTPEEVTVVRSGPDLERLRRRAPEPVLKAGKPFLCAYLGVMGPQDGVDTVLEAAFVIVHEMGRRDCHFVMMGFGDCFEELRAQARRDGLDGWVTFTGRADDETLTRYLSTADIGLSPDPKNAFNDVSTMNKTVEYMAFGLPVVAFDLKETRVSAGDAAAYAPDGDVAAYAKAIVSLLDDPARREAMGAAGRERVVDSLAWEHQAPKYVAVYRELLDGARLQLVPSVVAERGARAA
jgi:glycosyltransferase involved in cell wall biosynthesis